MVSTIHVLLFSKENIVDQKDFHKKLKKQGQASPEAFRKFLMLKEYLKCFSSVRCGNLLHQIEQKQKLPSHSKARFRVKAGHVFRPCSRVGE